MNFFCALRTQFLVFSSKSIHSSRDWKRKKHRTETKKMKMASWKAGQNVFQLDRTSAFVCHFQCDWRCHVCQSQIHEWKMKTRNTLLGNKLHGAGWRKILSIFYLRIRRRMGQEQTDDETSTRIEMEMFYPSHMSFVLGYSWFCCRCFVPVSYEHLQTSASHVWYKGHRCSLTWRLHYCLSECGIDEG